MLQHTFVHIPGIGLATEKQIWQYGYHRLADFKPPYPESLPAAKIKIIEHFKASGAGEIRHMRDVYHIARLLPNNEHWRLYPAFRHSTLFLDIETTGLGGDNCAITSIATYDGSNIKTFVHGENLHDFVDEIYKFDLIVSYNGKCFDVPMIERYFDIRLDHVHIDLRFLLQQLGYTGGLKGCEQKFGIDREELAGVNGYFAVFLWHEYQKSKDRRILETLLAYNILDTVSLQTLLVHAYNLKTADTPFGSRLKLEVPKSPVIPYEPESGLIERFCQLSS